MLNAPCVRPPVHAFPTTVWFLFSFLLLCWHFLMFRSQSGLLLLPPSLLLSVHVLLLFFLFRVFFWHPPGIMCFIVASSSSSKKSDARDAMAEPCLRRSLEIHEKVRIKHNISYAYIRTTGVRISYNRGSNCHNRGSNMSQQRFEHVTTGVRKCHSRGSNMSRKMGHQVLRMI